MTTRTAYQGVLIPGATVDVSTSTYTEQGPRTGVPTASAKTSASKRPPPQRFEAAVSLARRSDGGVAGLRVGDVGGDGDGVVALIA